MLQAIKLSQFISLVFELNGQIAPLLCECSGMHQIAHLPAGISDLAASLANCTRIKSVCGLQLGKVGVEKDAEARICEY